MWRYRGLLPSVEPLSLGEPLTALVEVAGEGTVLAKLEGGLPTGSFKDRGTAVTVSWLRENGIREIVVDSSGNAGASFAAYAARAGMRLRLFVPADASPAKLLQARAHGAIVVSVPGPRSAAGEAARRALDGTAADVAYGSHLWQPAFLAGTATFAYEVFEQLGHRPPDVVVAPLGGGTLLLGVHAGFARLRDAGLIDRVPRLVGVQSAACAPLARAFRRRPGRCGDLAGADHRRRHPDRPAATRAPNPRRDPRHRRRDRPGERRRDPRVASYAAVARDLRGADLGGRPRGHDAILGRPHGRRNGRPRRQATALNRQARSARYSAHDLERRPHRDGGPRRSLRHRPAGARHPPEKVCSSRRAPAGRCSRRAAPLSMRWNGRCASSRTRGSSVRDEGRR